MFTEPRIAAHGGYEVLAAAQAIVWRDGSTIGLHRVLFNGHADLFLRALQHDPLHWIVVDLRTLTPEPFEHELRAMLPRDHDGMVLFTLRHRHAGAQAFAAAALARFKAAWFAADVLANTAEQVAA